MTDVDRRGLLALGGGVVAASALPEAVGAARIRGDKRAETGGVLLFDAAVPEARALAGQTHGRRLLALVGDPVRLWRDELADHVGPVCGITRWSDYIVLRGLAEETRRRLRSEERVSVEQGPSLVSWSLA